MKAAVCYSFGQPLVIEDIEIDSPKRGEVKVRMAATAICHSDIHILRGEWGGDLPMIAGHEGAGVVVETGPDVTLVEKGDHVVVSLLRACGRCRFCRVGHSHLCNGTFALATESRLRNSAGQAIQHGARTACFAEYAIVDQSQLVRVPDAMALDVAALLACGVITGVGAVVNRAQVRPGSSVVVIGGGGVGLNAVQGAVLCGAYPIVVIDLVDTKLEAAIAFGATHSINASREDVQRRVSEITNGDLGDYVFVTVGSIAAATQAYALAGTRGTIVFVGIPDWTSSVRIPMGPTIASEKVVTGSSMGTTQLSTDVPRLVALYEAGRLKLDELITARYSLQQINEAIASTESGLALRNVICFESA